MVKVLLLISYFVVSPSATILNKHLSELIGGAVHEYELIPLSLSLVVIHDQDFPLSLEKYKAAALYNVFIQVTVEDAQEERISPPLCDSNLNSGVAIVKVLLLIAVKAGSVADVTLIRHRLDGVLGIVHRYSMLDGCCVAILVQVSPLSVV